MAKPAPVHHHTSHGPRDVLLPIVTLGFYGLRRFRPRSLYNFTAFLILAAWIGATALVFSYHEGVGYFMGPVLLAMAAVTFFRLVPPTTKTHKTHR